MKDALVCTRCGEIVTVQGRCTCEKPDLISLRERFGKCPKCGQYRRPSDG